MGDLIPLDVVQLESGAVKACEGQFKPIGIGNNFSGRIPLNSVSNTYQQSTFGYLHFEKIQTFPAETKSFVLQLYRCQSTFCSEKKTSTQQIFSQVPHGYPLPVHHLPKAKNTEIISIAYGDGDGNGKNDILVKLAHGGALLFLQPGSEAELLSPNFIPCSSARKPATDPAHGINNSP